MCILIHKPANVSLTNDQIEQCADSNPDGFGVAYRKGGRLHIDKGLWGVKRVAKLLRKLHRRECIIHWRWSTHGKVTADNCHPFLIEGVCGNEFVLAHNGVLDVKVENKDWSDTRTFADWVSKCAESAIRGSLPMVEKWHGSGNRLAFMWADGTVSRTGSWHELNGIWFSNLNWQTPKYRVKKCDTKCGTTYVPTSYSRVWEWSDRRNVMCHDCQLPLSAWEVESKFDRCQACEWNAIEFALADQERIKRFGS